MHLSLSLSLVSSVVDLLGQSQSTVAVAKFSLVEGLGLHKLHAVERALLVSVRVLLSAPEGAVPQLPVGRVTASQFVALEGLNLQQRRVVKHNRGVALAPIVLEAAAWREVAGAGGRGPVVAGVHVGSCANAGFCAESSRSGVQLGLSAGDEARVEPGASEGVARLIKGLVEHFPGLLCDRLANMAVIRWDVGLEASVAGDHSGLFGNGPLKRINRTNDLRGECSCRGSWCGSGCLWTTGRSGFQRTHYPLGGWRQ